MSLSGSLYVGLSGLNASSAALNTTAHNLSNLETEGYVRKQILFKDSKYLNVGQTYLSLMQTGMGVDVETVRQVRNIFLDKSYRQEAGRQLYYEVQYEAVAEAEELFGETEGVRFQQNMEDLWNSLQELSKTPNGVARSAFIQTASAFIERAENIYKQLGDYQTNLNTKIVSQVKRINEIGDEINKINEKVRIYESSGIGKANDLRDQRNLLLDKLSKMVDTSYSERPDGTVTVDLEGAAFVTQEQVYHMDTVKISASSDMLKPIWPCYGNADVYNLTNAAGDKSDKGSLKGLLITRGIRKADYTDIPLKSDYIISSTGAGIVYNEIAYKAAVLKYNNEVESSVIMTVQAQFDQLIHGMVTSINDVLCPNKEVTLSDGTKVKILDEENAPVGMDEDKTAGEALFNRKSMDRYMNPQDITVLVFDDDGTQVFNADGTPAVEVISKARIYNEEDGNNKYSLFRLGEIEINSKILKAPSYLPLSSNKGADEYGSKITSELLSVWKKDFASISPNTLTINDFDGYYTSFISAVGNRGQKLETISKNQASMVAEIDSKRAEVMGVSSDDELTNLIKYQHAYNAAARYINVVDKMLEHIVTNL
jgi:flagellar hook-associated protein 1 FlgK